MYPFPVWRRAPFLALLIVILVIAYAPSTARGTSTFRLAALSSPSAVSHIYVRLSSLDLHGQGYPNGTGWTTLNGPFPVIDLLSQTNQSLSQTISSATIHSGRYDLERIFFTNATIVVGSTRIPVAAPPALQISSTLPVSPNGVSDLLIIVSFDYAAIFASSPSLTFTPVKVSTA